MKIPGPDHPIHIALNARKVRVLVADVVIAESKKALALREASYPEVQYIPRADADMTKLTKTSRASHCPYKGDATYYSITAGGRTLENAVWSYETPFPAVQEIAGHLAFYPDKTTIETGSGT